MENSSGTEVNSSGTEVPSLDRDPLQNRITVYLI